MIYFRSDNDVKVLPEVSPDDILFYEYDYEYDYVDNDRTSAWAIYVGRPYDGTQSFWDYEGHLPRNWIVA